MTFMMEARLAALAPIAGAGKQLSEEVADLIIGAIAQGLFGPGDRLVEEAIASQLAVSRVPVREAIKTLQAQGILIVTPNRGARVATIDAATISQVQEARIALERIAAKGAAAAFRADPSRSIPLQDAVGMMEVVAKREDWAGLRRCDLTFHHELCIASGNEIVLKLWEALSRHIAIIFGREIASERNFEVVIGQHHRLLDLLMAGSSAMDEEIEAHIMRLSRQERGGSGPGS
jgi:DNA-binding GntR family transcriptional regulator